MNALTQVGGFLRKMSKKHRNSSVQQIFIRFCCVPDTIPGMEKINPVPWINSVPRGRELRLRSAWLQAQPLCTTPRKEKDGREPLWWAVWAALCLSLSVLGTVIAVMRLGSGISSQSTPEPTTPGTQETQPARSTWLSLASSPAHVDLSWLFVLNSDLVGIQECSPRGRTQLMNAVGLEFVRVGAFPFSCLQLGWFVSVPSGGIFPQLTVQWELGSCCCGWHLCLCTKKVWSLQRLWGESLSGWVNEHWTKSLFFFITV